MKNNNVEREIKNIYKILDSMSKTARNSYSIQKELVKRTEWLRKEIKKANKK